jgi:hypothetical protein
VRNKTPSTPLLMMSAFLFCEGGPKVNALSRQKTKLRSSPLPSLSSCKGCVIRQAPAQDRSLACLGLGWPLLPDLAGFCICRTPTVQRLWCCDVATQYGTKNRFPILPYCESFYDVSTPNVNGMMARDFSTPHHPCHFPMVRPRCKPYPSHHHPGRWDDGVTVPKRAAFSISTSSVLIVHPRPAVEVRRVLRQIPPVWRILCMTRPRSPRSARSAFRV